MAARAPDDSDAPGTPLGPVVQRSRLTWWHPAVVRAGCGAVVVSPVLIVETASLSLLWVLTAALVFGGCGIAQGLSWHRVYARVSIRALEHCLRIRDRTGVDVCVPRTSIYSVRVWGRFGVRSILTSQGIGDFPRIRIGSDAGIYYVEVPLWRDEARRAEVELLRWLGPQARSG